MIRSKRVNAYSDNAVLNEYYGLSTDTKPTENVATGSVFIEVDTGATFLYDEEGENWTEVQSGSSGGASYPFVELYEDQTESNLELYSLYTDSELQHKLSTVADYVNAIGNKIPIIIANLDGEISKTIPNDLDTDGTNFYLIRIITGGISPAYRIYGVEVEG